MDLFESCPKFLNIAEYCLLNQARDHPKKIALIHVHSHDSVRKWSYEEIWETVLRISSGFSKEKIPFQSHVFIHLPSSPDYIFAFFGAMLAGLVPIPSYEHLSENEFLFALKDSNSIALIAKKNLHVPCKTLFIENLKSISVKEIKLKTKAFDPAYLVYTSGTTDRPKGILHGHQSIWGRRPIRQCLLDLSEKDRLLHTDPLNFTYTFGVQFMDSWASGATAVLYTGKSPSWPSLINEYEITVFASTPSTYARLLQEYADKLCFPTLRHAISAGEPLKPAIIEKWQKATQRPLYDALGMTEINLFISTDHTTPRKKGSIGRSHPNRRVSVLPFDKGETPLSPNQLGCLAVHRSDPGLMLGYWHRPQEEKDSFRGEWFLTGDLVHQDEEGYFFFHGRKGTILKIDADTVSPQEVEAAMEHCPGLKEVACWAVNGPEQIPILALFVILFPGTTATEEFILSYAQSRLSDYKCPKRVYYLQSLPKDARGKLLRRELPNLINPKN